MPGPAAKPGRAPGAPERVGCGPRRSPGRIGGRCWPLGVAPGRGRWKMGLPRSGITCRGVVLAAGRAGAEYTGRGPVCGTIRRRGGAAGAAGCIARSVPVACRPSACGGGTATLGRGGGARWFAGAGGAAASSATGASTSASSKTSVSGRSRTAVLLSMVAWPFTASCSGRVCACGGAGGAGGFGGITTGAGGRGTDCGVTKRGAGFASTGIAGCVLAAGGAGFGGTAAGGATVGRGTGGVAGRGGAAG